jgi:uncharacterized protein YcaQ
VEKLSEISLQQARNLMLHTLDLAQNRRAQPKKSDLLAVIRQLNFLQLDTISVVARAHHHILYSRLGPYRIEWLDELHAEGKLFEYLAHAMCFLPIDKFPIYWPEMLRRRSEGYFGEWGSTRQEKLAGMLNHIRDHGPVKSSDFKSERAGPWWGWKEEKILLESLFYGGELMIARREGFQRVYDLRERVLPGWKEADGLSMEASRKERFLEAARSLGVATGPWLIRQTYLPNGQKIIRDLVDQGELLPAGIAGFTKPVFIRPENLPLYEKAQAGALRTNSTKVLSMFDPLMVDRDRVKTLFNFDYRIQVYVPKAQCNKGYYLLPILHHGQLVGTLDAKAFRKEKILKVLSLRLEEGVKPSEALAKGLAKELTSYGKWLGLDEVVIEQTEPAAFKEKVELLLQSA